QSEDRASGETAKVAGVDRRVGSDNNHAASVAGRRSREGGVSEFLADWRAAHCQRSTEVALQQHPKHVGAVALGQLARRSPDAAFPSKTFGASAGSDGSFFDRPGASVLNCFDDMGGADVHASDVVEAAVVGFADQRVDASYSFIAALAEGPAYDGFHGSAHA